MTNQRQKQTYYGVLNVFNQEFFVKAFDQGNSESTIAFLQALLAECPQPRIALIWDGATYHRSQAVKDYLALVNRLCLNKRWDR